MNWGGRERKEKGGKGGDGEERGGRAEGRKREKKIGIKKGRV
jgi:hypothetical protein